MNPEMNNRHGEKRVEACGETFPADDQAAIFTLEPGKRPLGLEARHLLFDGPPPRFAALPHPLRHLGTDPACAEALAQVFGV
jgi:hypothetical protein